MRKRRRWLLGLLVLLVLLGLAGGGWGIYRWRHPVLHPVTVRTLPPNTGFLFSMGNNGYPAMETEDRSTGMVNLRWLNDLGRPASGMPVEYRGSQFCVSPHRHIYARLYWHPSDPWLVRLSPADGSRSQENVTAKWYYNRLRFVQDDGCYCSDDGTLFTREGKRIALPDSNYRLALILSADPRFLVLRKGWGSEDELDRLYIYEKASGRIIANVRYSGLYNHGMLFVFGDRFLAVPNCGEAVVFTRTRELWRGGDVNKDYWRWGEDGSVWISGTGTPKILHWREGACGLAGFPQDPSRNDSIKQMGFDGGSLIPRVQFVASSDRPGMNRGNMAAWGDGHLAAVTETPAVSPLRKGVLLRTAFLLKQPIASHHRVLTLYRDGRRIGAYRAPLPQSFGGSASFGQRLTGPLPTVYYPEVQEHLAFTADGRHLAWMLVSNDSMRLFVFNTQLRVTVFAVP